MVLDLTTSLLLAAILGGVISLALAIGFVRRGAQIRTLDHALGNAKSELASQESQLERFDETRDQLEAMRTRVALLERQEATLLTRVEEREKSIADLRHQLENEFRSMSTKLVKEAGDALLREAAQNFDKQHLIARKDAETYSQSVSDLLKPMRDTLTRYEEGLRHMREQQQKAQGELKGQIATLAQSTSAVQAEARALASALKAGPKTRGRWGETTLRNVVELTGMSPYCDFSEQYSTSDDQGTRKQPDMIVRLPGERIVAVDSKVSLSDWLDAAAMDDPDAQKEAINRHGKSVWTHVSSLSAKDYAAHLRKEGAIDFVVMFMPGETFFTAAIDARPTLFQDAYEKGVLIATPTTLIAILKSIGHAWRQQKANASAQAVHRLAEDLYDSLRKTGSYLGDLGKNLERTVGSYNSLIGNVETRVLPKARKFAEYEMPGTEKDIPEVLEVETEPRQLSENKEFIYEPRIAASS